MNIASLAKQQETALNKLKNLCAERLENTPKRQREGMQRRLEAANLERTIEAMKAIIWAAQNNDLPEIYHKLTSRSKIEGLVSKRSNPVDYYTVRESDQYRDESEFAQGFRSWITSKKSPETNKEAEERQNQNRIAQLISDIRFTQIPGFFPTPKPLIEQMLTLVDINPTHICLEPSAGLGDIADAIKEIGAAVFCIEVVPALVDICKAKGHDVVCADFLSRPAISRLYDRIVMNPPFENMVDCEHVRHAYTHLEENGKLVSIMSQSWRTSERRKAVEFREWLETLPYHEVHTVDSGAFKSAFRATSVSCCLLLIER